VLREWQARPCSRRYNTRSLTRNKADGVNVTPITVVASIDPELLENLIDMEKIDADSVDDCTGESVMEFLEYTQERDASVTAEFVKAEVLAKVTFAMSEKGYGVARYEGRG
jgi:hypothetical protein